ncbi:2OG-Fe(II) oxygenase [Aureivirga sp. CE67]|uniref:2OG-Fe(II) oxygenase n=1 Tax=Aureivirga sp. CE67 TaxID=1788983 RepID=UPI0018CBB902|nr:2OG-Fe(II) oxygenase [Aureivirga sp. CE67]
MLNITRKELSILICKRLEEEKEVSINKFNQSKDKIGYFFVDDLLPKHIVDAIYQSFPKTNNMILRKSLREYKYIAAQMDNYHPILEEVIYAFQEPNVVKIVSEICDLDDIHPDENLYAGGLSSMGHKNFLNPHLDNSHDKDRNMWRVLNLLFYVTPDWKDENGGHLEVWPDGMNNPQTTIYSRYNRLAIMATHDQSWHSVCPVNADKARSCVSNYYFSSKPFRETDSFHVTKFRGRPEEIVKDQILKVDAAIRSGVRKVFKKGVRENPHVYKKEE